MGSLCEVFRGPTVTSCERVEIVIFIDQQLSRSRPRVSACLALRRENKRGIDGTVYYWFAYGV